MQKTFQSVLLRNGSPTEFINVLLRNGSPTEFIFYTVNSRIKSWIFNNNNKTTDKINGEKKKYFTVPYVDKISDNLKTFIKKSKLQIAHTIPNKLSKFIKTGKDKLDPISYCDVVYKINCKDCDTSYVGQTKKCLKTRIQEHRSDINKKSGPLSVNSQHRL